MDFQLVLAAGVGTGTILLFAAIGEIFAERSGVLNLGVEGMMLIGAVAGFSTVVATGNPWLALVVAMLAGGVLSLLHGVFAIHLRADQVVSGLALDVPWHRPRPGPRRRVVGGRRDLAAPAPDRAGPVRRCHCSDRSSSRTRASSCTSATHSCR